jgi:ribosomal protein S18 acetylase RimI-like enzyme
MEPDLHRATLEMAHMAAPLLHLTMGAVADYLFGAGNTARADQVLVHLFRARNNYFSHQFAVAAMESGEVTGLLISYSVRFSSRLALPTAFHLLRATGIPGFVGFLARARPLVGVKEAEEDEYFIGNIAVAPAFQGHGLGTHLLSHAEHTARDEGFEKIALTVEVENKGALAFYRRNGYEVIETIEVPALRERIGYEGLHRMRKVLR